MSKGVALFDSRAEALVAGLALAVLVWTSTGNYLLFHSLVELFAVFVGFGIFALVLNARRHIENGAVLVLGYAFFAVAGLDLLHALAYKGMGVFPGYDADLPTQLWIAARGVQAAAFLAAPFFVRRRVAFGPVFGLCAASLALLLLLIFLLDAFPRCYVEGQGLTAFKIGAEYAMSGALALSGLLLRRQAAEFDPGVLRLILLCLGLSVASELCLTLYRDVYGLANMAGHCFKLGAFYSLHKAVLALGVSRPHELLYRRLARSRERLAASELALKNAQTLARIGSYVRDASGETCEWSDELYRLLGYAPGETPGSLDLLYEHVHPEDRERLGAAVGQAVAALGQMDLEFRYRRRDGEVRHARGLGSATEDGKGGRRFSGAIQDVTEAVHARQLREEVERILRHDLRSPLAAIVGMAQTIRSEAVVEEVMEMARMIEESGERLMDSLRRSLDLYKMEQGTYAPDLRPVDLLSVSRRVLSDLSREMGRKGLVGEVLLQGRPAGPDGPFQALGEEDLCFSMLHNLVRNAVEASPSGRTVRIELRDGAAPELAVWNLGAVPEAIRGNFLEKGVTFGKKHGAGLGAYSARLMARAMGGDISFATSEESGTTVTVHLPRSSPASPGRSQD
ncbi:MAG: MASE3 domain-containing protein [Thermodesulfobacteriota bacterium]